MASVLLVGADTLLGKEVREVYDAKPRLQLATLATGAGAVFAATEEEIEVVAALDDDMLEDCAAIVVAASGPAAAARLRGVDRPVVDLTGEIPDAKRRIPHPAAGLVRQFLEDLDQPVLRAVVTAHEPASAEGRAGIGELQKQTVALLSFKPVPKDVFDAQLAFNLLAAAPRQAGLRVALQGVPVSIKLVRAPTFHGLTMSLWVEFPSRPNLASVAAKLRDNGVDVRDADLDPPDNTGMAGMSGYAAGAMELDPANANAAWFWLAADNLRWQADAAMEALKELL